MHIEKKSTKKNSDKNKNNKNKFPSHKSTNFAEVHQNIDLSSNNNTARKHVLLQQSSKLHYKLSEINIKNVFAR